MQELPVKDNFPARFYDEFARLVIAFGRIEYLIKLCVKDLHGEGFIQGLVEAEDRKQFSELCKKAKELAGEKLTRAQASAFSQLIKQAEGLAEFRNDTVHAVWTTDSSGQPLRVRPKRDQTKKSVEWSRSRVVPLSEIQGKREQIESLYQAFDLGRKAWSAS